MFYEKAALKNFAIFTGKLEACNFIKNRLQSTLNQISKKAIYSTRKNSLPVQDTIHERWIITVIWNNNAPNFNFIFEILFVFYFLLGRRTRSYNSWFTTIFQSCKNAPPTYSSFYKIWLVVYILVSHIAHVSNFCFKNMSIGCSSDQ